jgi:hypothetical protein
VIVAIRDVAPNFSRNDIPKLAAAFKSVIVQNPVAPILVLATMETEAWFIGVHPHFERIDPVLTPQFIQQQIGVDVISGDIESIDRPAFILNSIYQLAGLNYTKSKADVERTVASFDFRFVRYELAARVPSFRPLIEVVESFVGG